MATVSLRDKIKAKAPELFDIIYKDYRPDLDSRITILDLSFEALKVNVYQGSRLSARELAAYQNIYNTLQSVVREALAKRTYQSLDDPKLANYFTGKQPYPILIANGSSFFVVGKNFDAIRNFVTNNISRDPRLKASRFGEKTTYEDVLNKKGQPSGDVKTIRRTKVDIGHIPAENNENLVSPLEKKFQSILEFATTTKNYKLEAVAKKSLQELYDIQATISYDFKNTTPEAIEQARSSLGTSYVVVTLHTAKKNNEFSVREAQLYNKLVAEAALSIGMLDIPGSNTIIEDIAEGITNILKTGKSKLKKHQTRKTKYTEKKTKKVPIQSKSVKLAPPVIAETTQVSLSVLQNLLNANLVEQIKKNMGNGNRRDILNLRTGRFAESAKVERLSESRSGMITAFYSYMKNPYATFSEGGRQQFPRTRDPKLLISKSIREIAATQVANRMRAVLV